MADNPNIDDRMMTLEALAADQEATIEDLSDMVADQWRQIDTLKTQVKHLTDRLKRAEDRLPDEAAPSDDKPPPHY